MAQGPTPDPSSNQPILARSALLEGNCFWNRAANLGRKRAGASVWLRPPLAAEPWSGDWSLVTLVRSTLGPIPPSGDRLEDPVKAWKKDGKRVAYWSDWTSQITTANRPYPILCIYECPFCIILESASGRAEGEKILGNQSRRSNELAPLPTPAKCASQRNDSVQIGPRALGDFPPS